MLLVITIGLPEPRGVSICFSFPWAFPVKKSEAVFQSPSVLTKHVTDEGAVLFGNFPTG